MADERMQRVGFVLTAVGLLDIVVLALCIAEGISYTSSLGLPSIVAGVLLMRRNGMAAMVTRHMAALLLATLVTLVFVLPFLRPVSLMLAEVRADPARWLIWLPVFAALTGLLSWVVVQLGRAGRGRRIKWSAAIGMFGTLILAAVIFASLHGKTARYAEILAQEQVGPGYAVHVTGLNVRVGQFGTDISAQVTAWSEEGIKHVAVAWRW